MKETQWTKIDSFIPELKPHEEGGLCSDEYLLKDRHGNIFAAYLLGDTSDDMVWYCDHKDDVIDDSEIEYITLIPE